MGKSSIFISFFKLHVLEISTNLHLFQNIPWFDKQMWHNVEQVVNVVKDT